MIVICATQEDLWNVRGKGKRAFREVVYSGVKTEEAEEMINTLE